MSRITQRQVSAICLSLLMCVPVRSEPIPQQQDPFGQAPRPTDAPAETQTTETADSEETVDSTDSPQEEDSDNESEDAIVQRQFKQVAAEIREELKKRKEAADHGMDVLQQCRDEYREEYRQLAKQLDELPETDRANSTQRIRLLNRKKAVAIHLWQTFALEPIVSAGTIATNDLMSKLFEFMNRYPQFSQTAADKVNELQQLISSAQEGAMRVRMNRGGQNDVMTYHDMTPEFDRDLLGKPISEDDPSTTVRTHLLESLRVPLQRILQLKWSKDQISLDQGHWDELFGGVSVSESRQMILDRLAKHNIVIDQESYHPFGHIMRSNPNHLGLLVQNLNYEVHRHSPEEMSSDSEWSGNQTQYGLETTEIRVRIEHSNDQFEISINERLPPKRNIDFVCNSDGTLRLTVVSDQVTAIIQQPTGRVQVVQTYGDQVLHASEDSFLELYSKRTDFVENLWAQLDAIGIGSPQTRYDPFVADQTMRLLRLHDDAEIAGFAALVSDLDSFDFEKREEASRVLERDVELYVDRLRTVFATPDTSLELRSRIQRILELYATRHQESDELVRSLKLLDDPVYLANLLQKRHEEERPLLAARLEKLTGQALGADPAAWREWLANQPRP